MAAAMRSISASNRAAAASYRWDMVLMPPPPTATIAIRPGVRDGVEDVLSDVQLVEGGDDAEGQDEALRQVAQHVGDVIIRCCQVFKRFCCGRRRCPGTIPNRVPGSTGGRRPDLLAARAYPRSWGCREEENESFGRC